MPQNKDKKRVKKNLKTSKKRGSDFLLPKKNHKLLDKIIKIKVKDLSSKHDIEKLLHKKDLTQSKNNFFDTLKKYIAENEKKILPKKNPAKKIISSQEKEEKTLDEKPQIPKIIARKPIINPHIQVKTSKETKKSPYIINLKKSNKALKPQFKKAKSQNRKINLMYEEEMVYSDSSEIMDLAEKQEMPDYSEEVRAQFTDGKLFSLPLGWKKAIIAYIALGLLLIVPFLGYTYYQNLLEKKDAIKEITGVAYEHLLSAGKDTIDSNLSSANEEFSIANKNFDDAKSELDDINIFVGAISNLVPQEGKTVKDAQNLLSIGQIISKTGEEITLTMQNLSDKNLSLIEKIDLFKKDLTEISQNLDSVDSSLKEINTSSIPNDYQEKFLQIKENFPKINSGLKQFIELSDLLTEVLGKNQTQRYLLLFQNDTEMRATGGFIGSFALLDIENGEIKNLEIPKGGSYDLQGQLTEKVISPEPLHLINSQWQFQDSNWFFDYPTSAEKIQWFYEKSGGPTVDGVIAINASFFQNLLTLLGPISLPDYDTQITADNFYDQTQKEVEFEYDKENNTPKKFIADLAPRVIKQVFEFDKSKILDLAGLFNSSLEKKNILIYLNNPDLQKTIDKFQWSGKTKDSIGDYLAVVNTNIAGGKTDQRMDQKIEHQAEILEDGSVINTVKVTRTHTGIEGDPFSGVQNVDFMRFYVPEGSKILSASGFNPPPENYFKEPEDYYKTDEYLEKVEGEMKLDSNSGIYVFKENNKTVFGNWVLTPVGNTTEVVIKYELPFKVKAERKNYLSLLDKVKYYLGLEEEPMAFYSLVFQKQPGDKDSQILSKILIPKNLFTVWKYPAALQKDNASFAFSDELSSDKALGLIFQKK